MPAKPKVGDVYRTENVSGVVFEEVEVTEVGKTVAGPRGAIAGAIVARELHLDRSHENKTFAPGYGEFRTAAGGDLEALALAVSTDALPGAPPAELRFMSTAAEAILESARLREWDAAAATLGNMREAWKTSRSREQPRMVAARMSDNLGALTRAVKRREVTATAQSALDVAQGALDLRLRQRPPTEIDGERFHLWTQQLRVDAAAEDGDGVTGDVAVLEWIRDRIAATLGAVGRREVDSRLRELRTAADAGNLRSAADHAARLGARSRILLTSSPSG
jgi:hypothetical protein